MNSFAHGNVAYAMDQLKGAIMDLRIATDLPETSKSRLEYAVKAMHGLIAAQRALENAIKLESMTEAHE